VSWFVGFKEGLHVGREVEVVGITDDDILGKFETIDGRLVILSEGLSVGDDVGNVIGIHDGVIVGFLRGILVSEIKGMLVGKFEGCCETPLVGL
jgi:hypothetical protein